MHVLLDLDGGFHALDAFAERGLQLPTSGEDTGRRKELSTVR